MSVLIERSMGDMNKEAAPVYPLFQKGAIPQPSQPKKRNVQIELQNAGLEPVIASTSKPGPARRGRKPKSASTASTLPASPSQPDLATTSKAHRELLEVDPNNGRRKRRKTMSPEPKADNKRIEDSGHDLMRTTFDTPGSLQVSNMVENTSEQDPKPIVGVNIVTIDANALEGRGRKDATSIAAPQEYNESSLPGTDQESSTSSKDNDAKPRKLLLFNPKTGTIGSPPAKKSLTDASSSSKTSTRRSKKLKSRVVTFLYGEGHLLPASIGEKIANILNNTQSIVISTKVDSSALATTPAVHSQSPRKPAKSTHPFFLGKAAPKAPDTQKPISSDPTIIDLTQTTDRTPQARARPPFQGMVSQSRAPIQFGGFGDTTKTVKFPGAVEPAWPAKDMVHVRGYDRNSYNERQPLPNSLGLPSKNKKSKYQAISILDKENILENIAADLSISNVLKDVLEIEPDDYTLNRTCLRVPTKHLESGYSVQRQIRGRLHTRIPNSNTVAEDVSEDEIQSSSTQPSVHPALSKAYASIATCPSAFDNGLCETQSWIHKHAPKRACDILQTGKEALILKEWLHSLTVQSVEPGLGSDRPSPNPKSLGSNGKRKRKSKKLDDFVISDGDDDMDEISEPEDIAPSGSQGLRQKTIVRMGDLGKDSGRATNAVVISGPSGCGKTAAVYAVAKELGFEVFEINPGSKRSGKEILDKIGDMTHNHQVQRSSGATLSEIANDDNGLRIDEALANDLQSGRQGTMKSFFTARPASQPKVAANPLQATKKQPKLDASTKTQKQSLILIEEADVLYKDDTQFWATIFGLIAKSKRPIVITCNDEAMLPMANMSLHAVIRMGPPPVDLAVDYMLLVAACEGHVIERKAVQSLYETKNMDLRASLTELNFWCQFAVGDQKNGLGWYLSRWPKGSDVDIKGHPIRVISEGTYKTGMGWLSQDILESDMHHLNVEEETLREAHDGWNLDVGDWHTSLDLHSWAEDLNQTYTDNDKRRSALQAYEEFTEAMSVADICSDGLLPHVHKLHMDPTMPEMTAKMRDDCILGLEILEAAPLVKHETLSKDISLWLKSRSRNHLHLDQHVKMGLEVPTSLSRPDESNIIQLIRKDRTSQDSPLTRRDMSIAFDPISEPEKSSIGATGGMEASVFDRTINIIVHDMAPYVRSIVASDARLQEERTKLSNLMSEGGRKGKKMRMTRAALSALEGGARSTTRKEKYFGSLLNAHSVMRTGMQSWTDAALREMKGAEARLRKVLKK